MNRKAEGIPKSLWEAEFAQAYYLKGAKKIIKTYLEN